MKFEQIEVTPELAATYLARNENNRRLDMAHVNKLAQNMIQGKWAINGDTIRFDKDGNLIDGQHRLNAIIRAGKTMTMLIVTGIEDENAFKTIDTNSKLRNVGQVLGLMGFRNSTLTSAISRRLIHWENVIEKEKFSLDGFAFRNITTAEVIEYAEKNNDELQEMILRIKPALVFKRCGAGTALITSLVIINRFDKDKAQEFIDILHTGYSPLKDSPGIALRDRLLTPPERRGYKWELEIMACTIKTFNRYFHNSTLKNVKWVGDGNNKEKFPIPGATSRSMTMA